MSGYRPIYQIQTDYWTSVHHEFTEVEFVATGDRANAEVWFLSPEQYPHSLWVGRELPVAEGSRKIGNATVLKVLNPVLLKNGA